MSKSFSFNQLPLSTKNNIKGSDNSTIEDSTEKSTYTPHNKNQQNKDSKKDEGWLSFINQKLNEWPLWLKVSSVFKGESDEVKIPKKDEEQKKPAKLSWGRNLIKIKDLPWKLFFSRGRFRTTYQFYHCKEDNLTYFFQNTISLQNPRTKHSQILQPPKQVRGYVCVMPTELAIPKLQAYMKNTRQDKY